jgi:hypothetical protein
MFESPSLLERHIESPDAAGVRIFDVEGNEFQLVPVGKSARAAPQKNSSKHWFQRILSSVPVHPCVLVPMTNSAEAFKEMAIQYIRTERTDQVTNDHMQLDEIVELLRAHLHYTK